MANWQGERQRAKEREKKIESGLRQSEPIWERMAQLENGVDEKRIISIALIHIHRYIGDAR